ncbi:hypothetical protein [Geodermatophilus sp. URMC 60]|jgi:hypothetical protein
MAGAVVTAVAPAAETSVSWLGWCHLHQPGDRVSELSGPYWTTTTRDDDDEKG